MRILVIANLPPYVLGGAENQVAQLVGVWANLGQHIEVAGHRIPDGVVKLGGKNIRTHRIKVVESFGRAGRAGSYFISLSRLLSRFGRDFDIVYCRGLGDGVITICLLKAFGRIKLPLMACPINARGAGDASFIRSIPGWRWIVRSINRHCEAINIIAPAIEPDLIEIGLAAPQLSRVPNGITLLPPLKRDKVPNVRRLIWTGRLSPQKGLDLLLLSLARVASSGLNFHLVIVGEGPELVELSALCTHLGLDGFVDFAGAVVHEDIKGRLAKADVFVLPSRYEGMSNSALEAMESGLPLLLTRCGGVDSYVDDSIGWVCMPNDVDDLTITLIKMINTSAPEILAMGNNARELVESNFEIGMIARKNLEIMAGLLNEKTVADSFTVDVHRAE